MPARSGNISLVREWIKENGKMPDGKEMPKTKMARLIYKEHYLKFKDEEHVRATINKVTGKSGKKAYRFVADKSLFESENRPVNPYSLPESDEKPYEPFIINGKRILILSDIHIPYHNIPAVSAAIKWGKTLNPDTILLNGDTLDFYQGSDYVRDKTKKQICDELEVFKDFISVLRLQFSKTKLIFKEGNHSERYNTFLYKKAGELQGLEEFSLESIIRKRAGNIDYVGDKRVMKAGNLNIIHGHEFKGGISTPVNIARGLFLKARVSCIQGHNHQTSEHTQTDMNGKMTTTWSVGCLSELHPQYMPLNQWNHGCAFVEVHDNGDFHVQNKRILDGEIL